MRKYAVLLAGLVYAVGVSSCGPYRTSSGALPDALINAKTIYIDNEKWQWLKCWIAPTTS